jgi:hypothetical protein
MRKLKLTLPWILATLICSILIIGYFRGGEAAIQSPSAPPIIPDQVYGLVRVNNIYVPAGTLVSAWCGGTKYAEKATVDDNGETWYSLDIPGDEPLTPAKEGCSSGETISFKIASDIADQQKAWAEGNSTQLDLSLTNLILIYIPVVMK